REAADGGRPQYPPLIVEAGGCIGRAVSPVSRDVAEVEQLTPDFALRDPGCRVARIRLGYRMTRETSLGRYLSFPLVPTFAGFDPRLQLLHEEDAAEAIARAALGDQEGVFNVAGDGVLVMSQAIAIMGARATPVLPPYGHWASRVAVRVATGVRIPAHMADLLMHGSVVDCSRLQTEFGWRPTYSTRA